MSSPATELVSTNQCQHLSPRGQHCRMLRVDAESLCPYHLRQTRAAQSDPEVLAAELLESTGNLNTADRVNALLANVTKALARQRIGRHDALALGYLAQLLLNTVPGVHQEHQALRAHEAQQARAAQRKKTFAETQAARLRAAPSL